MKTVKLRALKGCPKQKEGAEFMATGSDAKALIAIGRAERVIDATQTYQTRDMGNAPNNKSPAVPPPAIIASDTVRAFAIEKGIDISTVAGTGQGGRILKSDIQALIKN